MIKVSEFIGDKWGSAYYRPSKHTVMAWLQEYAKLVVDACVDNLEADPNDDEPGQWVVSRESIKAVKSQI